MWCATDAAKLTELYSEATAYRRSSELYKEYTDFRRLVEVTYRRGLLEPSARFVRRKKPYVMLLIYEPRTGKLGKRGLKHVRKGPFKISL
ncbi:hypothetical protein DPMN_071546 [Dreissena polymorpha]|uniref:Uncharacterized protein n=1 Tax=Dreissena polymorpha TaxID=45954 RepID=A0A9D4BPR9_DREPO|nr:hypothetical protein DPMN_071546 [Dreissena polymorpha]